LEKKKIKLEKAIAIFNDLVSKHYIENISLYNKNVIENIIDTELTLKRNDRENFNKINYLIANKNNSTVIELTQKTLDLYKINQKIKDMENDKIERISFEEKLQLIKTYANEIINEKQLSNCPACGKSHGNVDKLLDSVNSIKSSSSELIETAIITLTNEKKEIALKIKQLNKTIEDTISSKRQLITQEISVLENNKISFKELTSILSESKITRQNTKFECILSDVNQKKEIIKRKINTINKKKTKYNLWCDNVKSNTNIEQDKINSYTEELNEIKTRCFIDFKVDINNLIYNSKFQHVFLFKKKESEKSIKQLENSIIKINESLDKLEKNKLSLYEKSGFNLSTDVQEKLNQATLEKNEIRTSFNYIRNNIHTYTIPNNSFYLNLVITLSESFSTYSSHMENSQLLKEKESTVLLYEKQIITKEEELTVGIAIHEKIKLALDDSIKYFSDLASNSINSKVLNDMFMYIEPHLTYDEISFKVDINGKNKGIYIQAKSNRLKDNNTPIYYLSEAQINILSICIFLAEHAKDSGKEFNTIIIDDPVQSMDDLNSYALIDLCKIFSRRFNKQVIITTHNRSFYNLFKDKLPSSKYMTKYISL
jgi:exonuclease VII small subunit